MGVTGAPGERETTLVEVLNDLAEDGYDGQLIAVDDGALRCTSCDEAVPADDLAAAGYRRLEGASDPADMNLVVWGSCPRCGARDVAILGYGPNASAADADVITRLDLDDVEDAGHTTEEP